MHKIRCIVLLLCVGCILTHSSAQPAATQAVSTLFQIGQSNAGFHDFALIENYKDYSRQFPNDVNFTVGKSDPKQDWPWIHPGPADGWADRKVHPFKINFEIAKLDETYYRLVIDYAGIHPADPPTVAVDINGQQFQRKLPAGDNTMVLENFKAGKIYSFQQLIPPDMLHVGENSITLTDIAGSWAIYGDIRLESGIPAPTQTLTLQARPLPFFKQTPDGLQRAISVSIGSLKSGVVQAELAWQAKDKSASQKLDLHFGENQQMFITVPDGDHVELSLQDKQQQINLPVALPPARKWLVYIVATAHTDIGYTDLQENVRKRHANNGLTVLQAMDDHPEFKWYSETFWQLNALLQLHPEKTDEVFQRLREKRWGLSGDYANMLTGLCSSETLDRITLNARNLANRGGFELNSLVLDDVPSAVGSMPMVLANSGIKYFIEGSNKFRAPYSGLYLSNPFYWEGPDGSRVLSEIVHGYGQARRVIEKAPEQLPDFLAQFEKPDYPYDAVLVNGAFGDNGQVQPWILQAVQQWNSQWAYPKLIFAQPEDFFGYIEKNFGGKIPTIKADFGTWWEDGAASTALETAMSRRAEERIVTAEMLHSLGGIIGKAAYPKADFDKAWDNILLYNEHSWGARASVTAPNAEMTINQWKVKQQNARDADSETRKLLDSGMTKLAAMVPKSDLVVFNPLAWSRSAVVDLKGLGVLQDVDSQKVCFCQGLPEGGSCMVAHDLPSVGYRTYRLATWNGPVKNAVQISGNQMENEFYRVTLNPKTGGIQSIFDKQLNRELVDPNSEYNLGELIYVSGGDGRFAVDSENKQLPQWADVKYNRQTPTKIDTTNGPVFGELTSHSTNVNFPSITLRVRLYRGLKQIDLIFELNKTETLDKEAMYLAFPFAVDPAKDGKSGLWLEYPDEIIEPLRDQHASACRAWYSVQHWLAISDGDSTVEMSPLDAPLFTVGKMADGTWPRKLSFDRGHLFGYIMNNYWHTNYKASQGGECTFRYSITSSSGGFSKHDATIAGWNMYCPAVAARGQPELPFSAPAKSLLASPAQSLVAVQPLGMPLTTIKQAEDGSGYIFRLCDFAGEGGAAKLTFPEPVNTLFSCDLVECHPHETKQSGKTISVPVSKFAPITLKARFEP